MFKKFTTKELVLIAIIAAFVFAFDIVVVSLIDIVTGVPGAGFLVDTLIVVAIAVAGGLAIKKFGTFTSIILIYSVLSIPTNILGPPGVYKVFIGVVLGLIIDLVILAFSYKKIGYMLSFAIGNTIVIPVLYYALIYLGLPGAAELKSAMAFFIVVLVVESVIASWIGIKIYEKKLKNARFIKQIRR